MGWAACTEIACTEIACTEIACTEIAGLEIACVEILRKETVSLETVSAVAEPWDAPSLLKLEFAEWFRSESVWEDSPF